MKKFYAFFLLVAATSLTISCDKNPTPDPDWPDGPEVDLHPSLTGTDYAVICMDKTTYESIEDKVSLDLFVDGGNITWTSWAQNIRAVEKEGTNFYGVDEQNWFSLELYDISKGWSGGGLRAVSTTPGLIEYFAEVNKNPSDYYLHFAYRTKQENIGLGIYPQWVAGEEGYKFAVGDAPITFYDSSTKKNTEFAPIQPISGEYKVGEWNEYEVCVGDFNYDYSVTESTSGGMILFSANPGTQLNQQYELDAIFYYKKADK